jgi:hypothetical protein
VVQRAACSVYQCSTSSRLIGALLRYGCTGRVLVLCYMLLHHIKGSRANCLISCSYRCFVIDLKLTRQHRLRTCTPRTLASRITHHCTAYLVHITKRRNSDLCAILKPSTPVHGLYIVLSLLALLDTPAATALAPTPHSNTQPSGP